MRCPSSQALHRGARAGLGSTVGVVRAGVIATVVACVGVACARGRPEPTGVIVVGITSSPTNLDPRFGLDDVSQKLHQLIYDPLLSLDDRMQPRLELAESFEAPTPTTYVVSLRQGVRFHDGHELTSADVVHTFRSMLDPALASPRRGGLVPLESIEALDRYRVRFGLTEPFTSFPVNLLLSIVPHDAGPELSSRPNGTGAYRVLSASADEEVSLQPFAEHWRGAPRNSGLRMKVVPDEMMRALELRHGTMDMVVNDVSPDIYYQLRDDPVVRVSTTEGLDCQYVGVNLRDPVLHDRRVRQAIAYAIDRQAIVDHLRRGLARRADGLLPPQSWAYAPDVRVYDHDPARARALLDEAGFPDPDGDGPRPRLRVSLKVSNLEFNRLQSAVLQEQLRTVGIALDVRAYEFATLFADVGAGNFQLFTLQWTAASLADPDILRRIFHSSQVPPVGFNRGHYANADLDDRLERAAASRDDRERRALYADAQRILAEDLPYIPLWFKTNFALVRRGLTGVALNPFADLVFLRHVARNEPTARR